MNIGRIKPILKAGMLADDSVLMEGPHGIGKSEIVKQYCDENGYHIETLILSLMDLGDLLGMPHIENKITTWAEPDWIANLNEAAWPSNFDFEDLEFEDLEFKEFVKKNYK